MADNENTNLVVCGKRNQYSALAVSGCAIFALEAAIQLLLGNAVSPQLVDDIIDVGSEYDLQLHIEVNEVVQHVNRFKNVIRIEETKTISLQSMCEITTNLRDKHVAGSELNRDIKKQNIVVAIITKPPETIMLAFDGSKFILFDSHSRSLHSSAAFLQFENKEETDDYLFHLFPIYHFDDREMSSLQAELFTSVEINFVVLTNAVINLMTENNNADIKLEAPNFWIFEKIQLHRQIQQMSDEIRVLNNQLANERNRSSALEMQLNDMLIDQLRSQGFY